MSLCGSIKIQKVSKTCLSELGIHCCSFVIKILNNSFSSFWQTKDNKDDRLTVVPTTVSGHRYTFCWGALQHYTLEKGWEVLPKTRLDWAIQAGLLTPLPFAQHRLSPLAAFTSSVYFLHNGRWWQWICEFYTANFKGIFLGPWSECVWKWAITCCLCYMVPQNAFFLRTHDLLVSQKTTQRHFFFHPPSPFHSNFCNHNSIGICTALQF